MALTPRMQWSFPDPEVDPYYDAAERYAFQQDVSAYASREDRNILVLGGGTVSFTALTSTLAWPEDIEILSPNVGFLVTVEASSVVLAEGAVAYIDMPRSPTDNVTVQMQTGIRVPSSDTALLFAVRRGNYIYFRTGGRIEDGTPGTIFGGGSGGGGGGASTLAAVLAEGNTTGGTSIQVSNGDSILSAAGFDLNVTAGSGGDLTLSSASIAGAVGGAASLVAGSTTTAHDAGSLTLSAGENTGLNAVGGDALLKAGSGETGGSVNIRAGDGPGDVGGTIVLRGALGGAGVTRALMEVLPDDAGNTAFVRTTGQHRFTKDVSMLQSATPAPPTAHGSIFVSDGTGGLVSGGLYYIPNGGSAARLGVVDYDPYTFVLAGKTECDGATAEVLAATVPFNAGEYANFSTFKFEVVLSINNTGDTGEVYLFNLDDNEEVTGSRQTITGAGSDAPTKYSATLTVGAAAGNLKDTEKLYEVYVTNDATGDDTRVTLLGSAAFRLEV